MNHFRRPLSMTARRTARFSQEVQSLPERSSAPDEELHVKHVLLYFTQSRRSLVTDFLSPLWPKRLTMEDKAALKPGTTLNMRPPNGNYYKVILCYIGKKEDCEREQRKVDNRMATQRAVTENLSFLDDSFLTIEDDLETHISKDQENQVRKILLLSGLGIVHGYSGIVLGKRAYGYIQLIV